MAVLELRSVSKQFAGERTAVEAVRDVSLSLQPGEFFSLLGPSGCGKTTLLRMIAGFDTPTTGQILLKGEAITHMPPHRRSVNTVFQNYALFPHLNVRQNVEFGLRFRAQGKGAGDAAQKVERVLEQVRLEGKNARMPAQLSGGERQRVALARALVLAPDVLLLDEPLSALDPLLRKQVRGELKDLQRRIGVTFLFVTHDQEEALLLSTRMAVMNAGRVEQVGAPRDLYHRPATRFVASFLGAMNWIDGAGVRPEAARIERAGAGNAVVTEIGFLGPVQQVEARLDSGEAVTVQVPHGAGRFAPGERVCVTWDRADEVRFPA